MNRRDSFKSIAGIGAGFMFGKLPVITKQEGQLVCPDFLLDPFDVITRKFQRIMIENHRFMNLRLIESMYKNIT